jgi:hypothetical protein
LKTYYFIYRRWSFKSIIIIVKLKSVLNPKNINIILIMAYIWNKYLKEVIINNGLIKEQKIKKIKLMTKAIMLF